MKHLSQCNAGNFGACTCQEIRSAKVAEAERNDFMRRVMSNLDDALTKQNIAYHDRIIDLETALRSIDAVAVSKKAGAAVKMQRIARKALAVTRPQNQSPEKE